MIKKLLLCAVIITLGIGVYLFLSFAPTARGGSGYAAKNICSGYFLSGYEPELIIEEALGGSSGPLASLNYDLDLEKREVTTNLYGLFSRKAVYTPGIGCILLPSGKKDVDHRVSLYSPVQLSSSESWPIGSDTLDTSDLLSELLDAAFAEGDASGPRNTKAVVIVHNGELIAERYADGVDVDTPLIGWSMAKSVTALMVGILVKDNVLSREMPAPVPQWQKMENDPRAEITLDQLLRMSSGLEFDETYTSATDVTQMLSNEPDTAAFAANKPLIGPPDTIWSYSSGTSNILSAIIRRSVGDTLQDYYAFSQERLFRPLGMRTAVLEPDYSGNFVGSSYLYASARDWARLGQLCLQDGVWNGQRILPHGWVDYLVAPTPASDSNEYGAQFWLNRSPTDPTKMRAFPDLPEDAYYMSGFQGQIVLVVPSANLVITRFGFTPARNHGIDTLAAQLIPILPKDGELN